MKQNIYTQHGSASIVCRSPIQSACCGFIGFVFAMAHPISTLEIIPQLKQITAESCCVLVSTSNPGGNNKYITQTKKKTAIGTYNAVDGCFRTRKQPIQPTMKICTSVYVWRIWSSGRSRAPIQIADQKNKHKRQIQFERHNRRETMQMHSRAK